MRPTAEDVMQGLHALTLLVVSLVPVQTAMRETDLLVQVVTFSMMRYIYGVLCTRATLGLV